MNIPLGFVEKASAFEEIVVYLSETALSMEKMSLPYEVWRAVVGYEGYYEVSNFGRAKSLARVDSRGCKRQERILKPVNRGNGYLNVALYKDGKQKTCSVHRLVAKAFIPNPDNLPCVNHKDQNKQNNFVENLEWCTYEYNNKYRTRLERVSKTLTNGKKSKCVVQKTLDGELIKVWPSVMEVERQTGWSQGHISECCRGERKSAYGSIWSYTKKAESV